MKNNILTNKKYCYGCGVCEIICPKKIISLQLDSEGFYYPTINNNNLCIECGLCTSICGFEKTLLPTSETNPKGYAAWSNNDYIRINSSSGGVSYEILSYAIENGYKACVVRYNIKRNIAEHYIATNKQELLSSLGSKYIQSYTVKALNEININEKNIIVGTPCQIHSIRQYIIKKKCEDNFILIDFFCHGVPSIKMWNKYLKDKTKHLSQINDISWREKSTGWHDSWGIKIKTKNIEIINKWSKGDIFYKLFLGHFCLGKSCHKDCKYKMYHSAADIRLGDLWGNTYSKDDKGVSAIICFTDKGKDLVEKANINRIEIDKEIVTEGQMKSNANPAYMRSLAMYLLKCPQISIEFLRIPIFIESLIKLPKRIINKLIHL